MRSALPLLLLVGCVSGPDAYYRQLYTVQCRLQEACEGQADFGSVGACRDYYLGGVGEAPDTCRFRADMATECLAYHRALTCGSYEDGSAWREGEDACDHVWSCD